MVPHVTSEVTSHRSNVIPSMVGHFLGSLGQELPSPGQQITIIP